MFNLKKTEAEFLLWAPHIGGGRRVQETNSTLKNALCQKGGEMCEETSALCAQNSHLHPPAVEFCLFCYITLGILEVMRMFWWRICTFIILCLLFVFPLVLLVCSVTTLSHGSALFWLFMVDHYATFAAANGTFNCMYTSARVQHESHFPPVVRVISYPKCMWKCQEVILIKVTDPCHRERAFQGFSLSHFMLDLHWLRCKHASTNRIFSFGGLKTRRLSHLSPHVY